MGCEPESSEAPRRRQPITSPHTRVMSYLPCCFLLIYFVLIFVPTLSIFICYFHRLMNGIVPGCVRVEGKGPPLQQPPLFPVCPSVVNILASSSGFVAFILRFSDTQIDFLLTKLYCGQNFKCYLEIN